MNLHKNISLTLVGVVAVFAVGSYFALSKTLIPAFDSLEMASAERDMNRVLSGLSSYSRQLSYASTDWSQWDETYAFVEGQNPSFESENLELDSLVALGLNVMAIYDLSGMPTWDMFAETDSEITEPVAESIIDGTTLQKLQHFDSPTDAILGLVRSGRGSMMVMARPITHSDKSGPVVGTLIMGRLLDESRVADLREITKVALDITEPSAADRARRREGGHDFLGLPEQTVSDDSRVTRKILYDVHDDAIAVLTVESPRHITGLRRDTVTTLIVLFAALGAFIVVGLSHALNRIVVRPVSALRQKMVEIEQEGDLSERVNLQRTDEIGDLSEAFDSMLQELEDARTQHIDQSFKAGMAEVAAGTLHNVRNALMPILNHVVMARDTAAGSKDNNARRAIDELISGDVAPDRREKLLQFLQLARAESDEECRSVLGNLGLANDQLDHVIAILKDQDKYTHADPVLERVNVAELIQGAAAVIPASDDLSIDLQVAGSVSDCIVHAHRVGLLQVFNNVFLNAYESIARTKAATGSIAVLARIDDDIEDRKVHITIHDSGAGIDPDALKHVFDRGYTSKDENTGGLGLHWSANAIASMGGKMSAFSAGKGLGAEIHVILKTA